MQKLMRITAAVFVAVMMMLTGMTAARAGDINGSESSIIAYASGTFTIDGVRYRVTSSAIGRLRAYLAQDNIDLSPSQASRAKSLISSNIRNGIDDGYLVAIDPVATPEPAPSASPSANAAAATKTAEASPSPQATVIIKKEKAVIEIKNADGEQVMKASTVIKNTGLSAGGILIPVFALAALFMTAAILAYSVKK